MRRHRSRDEIGIGTKEQRIGESEIVVLVDPARGLLVRLAFGRRVKVGPSQHRAEAGVRRVRSHALGAESRRKVRMVEGGGEVLESGQARGVRAAQIALDGEDTRFVEQHDRRHVAPERARHRLGVVGEAVRDVAAGPAALVRQRLRQVPMVEAWPRLDPARVAALDQPPIEVEPGFVGRALAARKQSGPGERETVDPHAGARREIEILFPAVVMIAGDLAGFAARDLAGSGGEPVPNRFAAPAFAHRALDLVGGGRGAEREPFGKVARHQARSARRRSIDPMPSSLLLFPSGSIRSPSAGSVTWTHGASPAGVR